MPYRLRRDAIVLIAAILAGCSYPGEKQADARRAAAQSYAQAETAFTAKDFAAAETSFTAAIDLGGLNPDLYCDAIIRRAVCRGATGKYDEALADLQQMETGGGNSDAIYAARSYVLAKQGKAAEARAALAKARQYNRTVQEFKD